MANLKCLFTRSRPGLSYQEFQERLRRSAIRDATLLASRVAQGLIVIKLELAFEEHQEVFRVLISVMSLRKKGKSALNQTKQPGQEPLAHRSPPTRPIDLPLHPRSSTLWLVMCRSWTYIRFLRFEGHIGFCSTQCRFI
ncbi:hypothetical protein J6590_020125 [Homalodisca vitripennis]|nr:hypothetical protein J6590_020125 [Homalodisca vitripennis]